MGRRWPRRPQGHAWFSEELAVKPSTLRLYDAHNKLLARGGIDPKVAKHDVMRLADAARGPVQTVTFTGSQ